MVNEIICFIKHMDHEFVGVSECTYTRMILFLLTIYDLVRYYGIKNVKKMLSKFAELQEKIEKNQGKGELKGV